MNNNDLDEIVNQLQTLVPNVHQCRNELEFIECITNYIRYLQSQVNQQSHNKRDILRTIDSNLQ